MVTGNRIQTNRKGATRVVDHILKLIVLAVLVFWLFVPGLRGLLSGEVNTSDVFVESFVFAVDNILGTKALLISLGRMVFVFSVVAGMYRSNVSNLLGLELYGPKTFARILFVVSFLLYLGAVYIEWVDRSGGF